jgi:hypothetical protein
MKFCQPHWVELRKQIESAGLSALVAESGKQAVKNLASEVEGGTTVDNFDPLMNAHNYIWGAAMNLCGMVLMQDNENGSEKCPLCYLATSLMAAAVNDSVERWKSVAQHSQEGG